MEPLLNRWRGTGIIFKNITGTQIYAFYYFMLFSYLTKWYLGIMVAILFMLGEGFSWGKWVGYLTSEDGKIEVENKKGSGFPYIHQVANFIVPQTENYLWYCRTALFIRGLYWALLIYLPLIKGEDIVNIFIYVINSTELLHLDYVVLPDYVTLYEYITISLVWAISFPLACWLSIKWYINYQSKYLNLSQGWEMQEVYYGVAHMLCNWYLIYKLI